VHQDGFIYKNNFVTFIEQVAVYLIKAALITLAKPVSAFHYQNPSQSQFRDIPASSTAITRSPFTQKRDGTWFYSAYFLPSTRLPISLALWKEKKNPFSFFPHKKQNPKTSTLTKKLPICELHVSSNVHFSFLCQLVRRTATELVSVGPCILSNGPSYQYQKNWRQRSVFCWVSRLFPPFISYYLVVWR